MGDESTVLNAEDTLRIGLISPAVHLDPARAHFFVDQLVGNQIYDAPLAQPVKSGEPTSPLVLAEELRDDSGGEGMAFSAPVREDLLFSDGTPLTPSHVLESLKRAGPLLQQADVGLDGDRLVFQLKRPNARFDLVLAQAYLGVTLSKGGQLFGTGPYTLDPKSTPQEHLLVRNPHCSRQAKIDRVHFKSYETDSNGKPTALLKALEAGEVDFTNVLPQEDVRDLMRVRKFIERGNSMAILFLNTERPALQDVGVRQAIGMSIDRLAAAEISYNTPMAYAAKNILPLSMSSWRDGIPFDLDKAKDLLQNVSSAKPNRLVMRVVFGTRPYLPQPMLTAEYIASQLKKLDIEVVIKQTRDGDDFVSQAKRGDYDMLLGGWVAESDDPAEFFESLVSERTIPTPSVEFSNHCNMSRWRFQPVEEALEILRREPSDENQKKVLSIVADEIPMVPIMTGSMVSVHSYRVGGFEPTPWGIPDFSKLELRG